MDIGALLNPENITTITLPTTGYPKETQSAISSIERCMTNGRDELRAEAENPFLRAPHSPFYVPEPFKPGASKADLLRRFKNLLGANGRAYASTRKRLCVPARSSGRASHGSTNSRKLFGDSLHYTGGAARISGAALRRSTTGILL